MMYLLWCRFDMDKQCVNVMHMGMGGNGDWKCFTFDTINIVCNVWHLWLEVMPGTSTV